MCWGLIPATVVLHTSACMPVRTLPATRLPFQLAPITLVPQSYVLKDDTTGNVGVQEFILPDCMWVGRMGE